MLKLKRVEIHGFKSFYDRIEMKFSGRGIAAVVGPNGCGKSNLSDAISWVLGEQSAKSLRGARMEDVIFAGSRDRKALGMATVTMTLIPDRASLPTSGLPAASTDSNYQDPSDGQQTSTGETQAGFVPQNGFHAQNGHSAPSGAAKTADRSGEITITRRLYRSGESEYLINGKEARLRDIQDLFLGTGLGPESYAIIEQGRIGQILSNKPQDRRGIIEEAAGITKFKTRKRLAEAKLESAKQNLARVFDILEEVTRQVNTLKRQAAKTTRYGELKTEATGYLQQILSSKFRYFERESAKIAIDVSLASDELQKAQTAINEGESLLREVRSSSYTLENELTGARQSLADLTLDAERVRGRLEYQTRQISRITEALESGQRELQTFARQGEDSAIELAAQVDELAEVERHFAVTAEELRSKVSERQAAQEKLTEQERNLEGLRQHAMRLLGESATLKNAITQIATQLASSDRDVSRAQQDERESQNDLARIQKSRTELSAQLASRQTDLTSVQDHRKMIDGELQQVRAEMNENRTVLDRIKNEVSRVRARKDSLEEVIQHRSYTTETVKRLFTAVERGKSEGLQPLGVLADFLDVDPELEKATEEFLHDELEYVVVRNWNEGEHGIGLMRGDLNGRATFLVEDAGRNPGGTTPLLPLPTVFDGTLTRLTDMLRATNRLSQLPIEQLPKIANCFVTGDRSLARELAPQFPHCWFLIPDGVNYHGQAVGGGKKSGAGPLALKRELREVSKLEEVKTVELNVAQDRQANLERTLASLSEEVDRLRSRQQNQEKEVLALDHESRKLAEEWARVQTRLSNARLELDRIARDRVALQAKIDQNRQSLQELEEVRAVKEEALEAARGEVSRWRDELARVTEEHAAMRATLASVEERKRSLALNRTRIEARMRDLAQRSTHLGNEIERMSAEKAHTVLSNGELEARTVELAAAMESTDDSVATLSAEEARLRHLLSTFEEELKAFRDAAQRWQEKRAEYQVSLARSESDIKHLEETCHAELNTSLAELVRSTEDLADETRLLTLDAKYTEIRRKIEALGPVNPNALEEFEEAQGRQEFLGVQRQDLLDSIRDTENAIHEIDGESRKRFGEAFHAINANFKEVFKSLFGGGVGEMRLTDEENLAESGIDIVASPPGKRLQSVLLLSGGEKALTAMALLMAIFQYSPSPFCVLDEIDAPLDDPNIERLTNVIRTMAADTQFIVITHSKRTMEAAQSLYGVTMQEPGVSKLVSVRLASDADVREETLRPVSTARAKLAHAT